MYNTILKLLFHIPTNLGMTMKILGIYSLFAFMLVKPPLTLSAISEIHVKGEIVKFDKKMVTLKLASEEKLEVKKTSIPKEKLKLGASVYATLNPEETSLFLNNMKTPSEEKNKNPLKRTSKKIDEKKLTSNNKSKSSAKK